MRSNIFERCMELCDRLRLGARLYLIKRTIDDLLGN